MKAWFRDDESQKIDGNVLEANGVIYRQLPMEKEKFQPHLDELTKRRGYVTQDEVALKPDTPNLDGVLAKFDPEHKHDDDEVRFVLEGEGIFDIRSNDERWMRVVVVPCERIGGSKVMHYRFELTATKHIHCVRLFKDPAGWGALYRDQK